MLLLPMLAAIVVYDSVWWFADRTGPGTSYLTAAVAQAQPAFLLGMSFVAASAGLSGTKARRVAAAQGPGRGIWIEALHRSGPPLTLGVLGWAMAVGISASHTTALVWLPIPLATIMSMLALIPAWTVLGYALGRSRLRAAGVILAVVLSLVMFAVAEVLPVRFGSAVSGADLNMCCFVPDVPSRLMLLSAVLMSAALTGIGIALLMRASGRRNRRLSRIGVGFSSCLLLAASVIAGQVAPYPAVDDRPGSPPCTVESGVQVRLWPEQIAKTPSTPAILGRAMARLRRADIQLPTTVTAQSRTSQALIFRLSPSSPARARKGLVQVISSPAASCAGDGSSLHPALLDASGPLAAVLETLLGQSDSTVVADLSPEDQQTWRRLNALPAPIRAAWVNQSIAAFGRCSDSAPPIPHL